MALGQRGDGGDQLGKGGAQRHKGEGDDRLGHSHGLGDQGAIVHQQVGADGDENGSHRQQQKGLPGGSVTQFRLSGDRSGVAEGLADSEDHINRKDAQQLQTNRPAEAAGDIGPVKVDGGGEEEKDHRGAKTLSVHLGRADGDGQCGDKGGVADDGADGIAIGQLSVAAHGRGGRHHHFGKGGADGDHRSADEQLGHAEPVGDAGGALHKPVAAFDQEQQTQTEQQNRNEHCLFLSFCILKWAFSAQNAAEENL